MDILFHKAQAIYISCDAINLNNNQTAASHMAKLQKEKDFGSLMLQGIRKISLRNLMLLCIILTLLFFFLPPGDSVYTYILDQINFGAIQDGLSLADILFLFGLFLPGLLVFSLLLLGYQKFAPDIRKGVSTSNILSGSLSPIQRYALLIMQLLSVPVGLILSGSSGSKILFSRGALISNLSLSRLTLVLSWVDILMIQVIIWTSFVCLFLIFLLFFNKAEARWLKRLDK
jgi:hypothetical protein